jgi:hypothetical protein
MVNALKQGAGAGADLELIDLLAGIIPPAGACVWARGLPLKHAGYAGHAVKCSDSSELIV